MMPSHLMQQALMTSLLAALALALQPTEPSSGGFLCSHGNIRLTQRHPRRRGISGSLAMPP
jgi:hypothetical protein